MGEVRTERVSPAGRRYCTANHARPSRPIDRIVTTIMRGQQTFSTGRLLQPGWFCARYFSVLTPGWRWHPIARRPDVGHGRLRGDELDENILISPSSENNVALRVNFQRRRIGRDDDREEIRGRSHETTRRRVDWLSLADNDNNKRMPEDRNPNGVVLAGTL